MYVLQIVNIFVIYYIFSRPW